jgi:hypothetical protein
MSFSQHHICCTCGTRLENEENGYCAYGHDDWISLDEMLYLVYSANVPDYKGYPKEVLANQMQRLQMSLHDKYATAYTESEVIHNFNFFTL